MKLTTIFLLLLTLTSACAPSNPGITPAVASTQSSYPDSYPAGAENPAYPSNPSSTPVSGKPIQTYLPPAQPATQDNPYAPMPGDDKLTTGNIYLDSTEILIQESIPPKLILSLRGSLPTSCHGLRVKISPPDPQYNIYVNVYSVADPNMVCAQTLQSFDASIPLAGLPPAKYIIWVNDEKVAEVSNSLP